MNKNVTYNLDEARLRGLLGQYETDFDEQQWLDTEKNLDALGLQRKANVQVNIRKLVVFAGLVVLGGGLVAFISYNSKSKKENLNSAFEKNTNVEVVKTTDAVSGMNETTGIKVSNEIPKLVLNRKGIESPVDLNSESPKKTDETLIAENISVNKKKEEVKENVSTDSKKNENSATVQNVDTVKKDVVTADNNDTKKKKKKKKKKHHNDDNSTAVTPSAGEDDVIISE